MLLPTPPRTDHKHVGCYLGETADCSFDLSAEHYMSRSVLEAIGPRVAINGAPWLSAGETREVGISSLTAKILCRRHNSALSPLDAMAGEFCRQLRAIYADCERKSISRKREVTLISGEALELWMLKAACGFFFSKNAAKDGARLIDDHLLNQEVVIDCFFRNHWAPGGGLYIRASQGHAFDVNRSVAFAPLTASGDKQVVGAGLFLLGLEFMILFDPIAADSGRLTREGWFHRPSELLFEAGRRSYAILLTWEPGTPPRSIRMTAKFGPRTERRNV